MRMYIVYVYICLCVYLDMCSLDFFRDRFTTLPDSSDRAFCTEVYCKYLLEGSLHKLNYDTIW